MHGIFKFSFPYEGRSFDIRNLIESFVLISSTRGCSSNENRCPATSSSRPAATRLCTFSLFPLSYRRWSYIEQLCKNSLTLTKPFSDFLYLIIFKMYVRNCNPKRVQLFSRERCFRSRIYQLLNCFSYCLY